MEITDVKVRLVRGEKQKVKAFCTVTFDRCFVVKDIKVIAGDESEFIAMPSRKISDKCGKCGRKNPIGASYCNSCGHKIPENRREPREGSLYSDIAHPINAECRSTIQTKIIEAYQKALEDDIPVAELADEPVPIDSLEVPGPPDEGNKSDEDTEFMDEPAPIDSPEILDPPDGGNKRDEDTEVMDEPAPMGSPEVPDPPDEGNKSSENTKDSGSSFSEGIL